MSESRKSIVERNENTSVTCRGNTSSAISLRCNQGTFDGGATYRSRPPDTQQRRLRQRRAAILEIILHSVELSKNASASSGDTDTSAISQRCNPGVFDSGVQSEPSSRHATREVSINNNNNIRYACTYLSPLRISISILSRLTTTFRQSRATTYRPYMYDM